LLQEVLDVIRPMGFKPILEGRDYLYFDIEDFANDPYGQAINRQLGKRRLPIRENAGLWEASKLSCDTAGADIEAGYRYLERNFQNLIHNEKVVESVPHGFSKGSGIRKVCELFGIPLSDTIAFGDSVNDLDMLETAGIGVAMGNGTDAAKQAADYVTTDMFDDGIWNACEALGLI
jgi:hydroxymethylpyrimidine pyrophosphatase-like HAD family hydrolase